MIYKTDPQIYKATAFMDAGLSGLVGYAAYKVVRNLILLANGMPWFPMYTMGWTVLGLLQSRYLMDEYLRQVFFVDEISIVGVDMDKLKVTTLLKGSFNVFAFARMNFFDRNISR